ARQGRVRLRRRERLEDRLRSRVLGRRARAPRTRVQRRAIRLRHVVDPEDPTLPRTLPRAGKAHALDMKNAVRVDPDGRTKVDRAAVEDPAANEPARRMAVGPAEEIAV